MVVLLQEKYKDDVWKLITCCIMLAVVKGTTVHNMEFKFFERFPNAESVTSDERTLKDMIELLRPLGFCNTRSKYIIGWSKHWLETKSIENCKGVGRYAKESYDIYVNKNYNFIPNDRELKKYVDYMNSPNKN